MTCHGCLLAQPQEPDTKAYFVRCPSCDLWSCTFDTDWCSGPITHPPHGAKELLNPFRAQNPDTKPIIPLHPPTRGPCKTCIDSGHADKWQQCHAFLTLSCPTSRRDSNSYCPDCVAEHQGRRCLCGAVWLCNTCSVADSDATSTRHHLVSCPLCGTTYCTGEDGCRYTQFCIVCRRTGNCLGCQAREKGNVKGEGTSSEDSQPFSGYQRCAGCWCSYICDECCLTAKDGVAQCSNCHRWMCSECVKRRAWCCLPPIIWVCSRVFVSERLRPRVCADRVLATAAAVICTAA